LADAARGDFSCYRLPKLDSDSWPPTSMGREVTVEGVTAEGLCLFVFWGSAFSILLGADV